MAFSVQYIDGSEDTAVIMRDMSETYFADCFPYMRESLNVFFDRVKRLPYRMEDGDFQAICRPYYTLNALAPVSACVNKSVCMGAYLRCRSIPYRYTIVAKSALEPYHHVYCEGYIGSSWIPLDATYANGQLGRVEEWGRKVSQ